MREGKDSMEGFAGRDAVHRSATFYCVRADWLTNTRMLPGPGTLRVLTNHNCPRTLGQKKVGTNRTNRLLPILASSGSMTSKTSLSYGQRAQQHPNPLARRLFEIAESKQTNIAVSADLTTTEELLSIAEGRTSDVHFSRIAPLCPHAL